MGIDNLIGFTFFNWIDPWGTDNTGILGAIFILGTIPASLSVTARRLHDRGHSGWNQLWILTIIGVIPILIMLMLPAKEDENKWGMNPLLNSDN